MKSRTCDLLLHLPGERIDIGRRDRGALRKHMQHIDDAALDVVTAGPFREPAELLATQLFF